MATDSEYSDEDTFIDLYELSDSKIYFLYMDGFEEPMIVNENVAVRFVYKLGKA